MAAIRVGVPPSPVARHIAIRRRLGWIAVAGVAGWMAATCLAILAVVAGMTSGATSLQMTMIATLIATPLLYWHFRRLGRVDEVVVIGIAISWSAILGILSL